MDNHSANKLIALLALLLAGCSPYVGYTHLSNPTVNGDGYDLACGGVKVEKSVELTIGACKAARLSGTHLKLDVEYVWRK